MNPGVRYQVNLAHQPFSGGPNRRPDRQFAGFPRPSISTYGTGPQNARGRGQAWKNGQNLQNPQNPQNHQNHPVRQNWQHHQNHQFHQNQQYRPNHQFGQNHQRRPNHQNDQFRQNHQYRANHQNHQVGQNHQYQPNHQNHQYRPNHQNHQNYRPPRNHQYRQNRPYREPFQNHDNSYIRRPHYNNGTLNGHNDQLVDPLEELIRQLETGVHDEDVEMPDAPPLDGPFGLSATTTNSSEDIEMPDAPPLILASVFTSRPNRPRGVRKFPGAPWRSAARMRGSPY